MSEYRKLFNALNLSPENAAVFLNIDHSSIESVKNFTLSNVNDFNIHNVCILELIKNEIPKYSNIYLLYTRIKQCNFTFEELLSLKEEYDHETFLLISSFFFQLSSSYEIVIFSSLICVSNENYICSIISRLKEIASTCTRIYDLCIILNFLKFLNSNSFLSLDIPTDINLILPIFPNENFNCIYTSREKEIFNFQEYGKSFYSLIDNYIFQENVYIGRLTERDYLMIVAGICEYSDYIMEYFTCDYDKFVIIYMLKSIQKSQNVSNIIHLESRKFLSCEKSHCSKLEVYNVMTEMNVDTGNFFPR